MICSCSIFLSWSKHCFLILNSWHVIFTKSVTCYLLHFCHASLNLLLSELAVAQCSHFVKNLDWIRAIYFVVMLECYSMLFLMHLDGLVLLITDQCHICFACHFQTVHPIPVIFISISTEINSSFQWHSWFSKLRPGSIFPSRNIAYHVLHVMPCFASCCLRIAPWLIVSPFACVLTLGRVGRRVRDWGTHWVHLRGSSVRQL